MKDRAAYLFLLVSMSLAIPAMGASKRAVVHVKGMVCSFCSQGVTKKLKGEAAVEKVDVSLENKVVTVDFKPGQELPDPKLTEIIESAGINVERIVRN